MLIIVRSFSYTSLAGSARTFSFSSCHIQTGHTSYTVVVTTTQIQSQMLCLDQTKTQEQGLTGYSSAPLTSRASHRLGKCRLSWVWLGFWLLSALSECNACSGRGSHRHASSGFISVQTRPTAQSWHDLVRTSVFPFTLIVPLMRSFSYTPRAGCFKEFHLHSSNLF